jgi:hypothetical protein
MMKLPCSAKIRKVHPMRAPMPRLPRLCKALVSQGNASTQSPRRVTLIHSRPIKARNLSNRVDSRIELPRLQRGT